MPDGKILDFFSRPAGKKRVLERKQLNDSNEYVPDPKKSKADPATGSEKAASRAATAAASKPPAQPAVKSPAKAPAKAPARRKFEAIDLDSSDDDLDAVVMQSRASQSKSKPKPSKYDDDDYMEEISYTSKASTAQPETKAAKTTKEPETKAAKTTRAPAPKASKPVEPVKAEPAKPAKPAGQKVSGAQILAGIPDAELPDVDDSKKFNFADYQKSAATAPTVSTEIPDAAENCLVGLTFVFTGIMPTLQREVAQDTVKRLGGKVTTSPSSRTSVVVLGEDAGPKKIQTIKKLGIKTITEEGFLQLLREMPADGGSSENAQKAMEKKKQDEEKVRKAALEMARENSSSQSQSQSQRSDSGVKSEPEGPPVDSLLWTQKYAPKQMTDICGNNTTVKRLSNWLQNWRQNHKAGFKSGRGEGSEFRAAMLFGPPGIGKTTAANLIAKLQGFDVIEYNASDTRSKSLLQSSVSQTLSNTSLAGFLGRKGEVDAAKSNNTKPVCVIMDEVDGMSAGDRGGVGAMAQLARTSNVPLILICNERTLPKMRPFDRQVFELQFRRPDSGSIRHRLMAIAQAEGLKVDSSVVDQLVQATQSDIRQILNLLSTYARTKKQMSFSEGKSFAQSWDKEIILKPFDILGQYMSAATWAPSSNKTLNDKIELYFNDYEFAPLMVQENYLLTRPSRAASTKGGALELAAEAAEAISDGDLVERLIRGPQQQWSLMPLHAVLSSVLPSSLVHGQMTGRTAFTSFLGNLSKGNKYKRLLAEVQSHIRLKVWAAAREIRMELQPALADKLLEPLLKKGTDGVADVIEFMDEYYLTREDWDTLIELGVGPNKPETKLKNISTQTKTAFTRKYNQMAHPLPFMKTAQSKAAPQKVALPDLDDVVKDDMEAEPETKEETLEEQIANNKLIKQAKKKPAAKKAPTKKAAAKKAPAKKAAAKK